MKANYSTRGVGGNPAALMKQIQKVQEEMETRQAELDAAEYDISAGGGMVTLKINGKKEVLSIDIKPEIVDPDDIETLSDILVAGVNEAIKHVEEVNSSEMAKVSAGMPQIPGLM